MSKIMHLSTANSKLKKNSIVTFDIPAYKAQNGELTCPNALACIADCYARQGAYNFKSTRLKLERNYALSKTNDFLEVIFSEIVNTKAEYVRIHSSGDFYSYEYLSKWLKIMEALPHVKFYAYTKQISLLNSVLFPANFTVIFSMGGREDILIDRATMRHSMVFSSHEERIMHGYNDTTDNDLNALSCDNHRVGLVYHGTKKQKENAGFKKISLTQRVNAGNLNQGQKCP